MSHDSLMIVPRSDLIIEIPMAQVPAAPLHVSAPTAQRIEVLNGVFTNPSEDRSAMGLLGIWGSVLLLHDLAADHLARPSDLDDLPRPDEDPDEEPAE